MAITRIILLELRHILVNFIITDEISVEWASNFSRNSEIKQ